VALRTDAEEYFPITFVEPMAANQRVLGLNPLSLAPAAVQITASRSDGLPHATAPFRLLQETGQQVGVVLYQAVRKASPGGPREIGVVSTALRMDDLVSGALSDASGYGVELCLVDASGDVATQRLSGSEGCESAGWGARRLHVVSAFDFAGRQWEVRLRADDAYLAATRSWAVWVALAVGLATIAMLGAFLLVTTGRTRRIQELVHMRTAELAAASARLQEQQAALAEAQRIAGMGSWELAGDDGQEVLCSDECRRLLGIPEGVRVSIEQLVTSVEEGYLGLFAAAIEDARETLLREAVSRESLDCRRRADDGSVHTLHLEIEGNRGASGRIRLRGTVQDVTAARDAEARIRRLADYDALTGLPNRSAWLAHARTGLAAARRHGDALAVLFIDLDNFKMVNDSLGHPVGDRLLAEVAAHLREALREEDILGRLGGDEFVALLPRLNGAESAAAVARKLLAIRERPIFVDGHQLPMSMSIGIAVFPQDGNDIDTLLKNADVAMYGAKGAGRNGYQFFLPEMNTRAVERLMLDGALRSAISDNQLFLEYQPQVDVETGRTVGFEALVRWQHPEMGLVPPVRFIPVAEISGLIVPLGDWVMRAAFIEQGSWRARGLEASVAINISAIQFRRDDFVDRVRVLLDETGLDPAWVEFEITESALMDPTDALLARLDQLRELGIRLALDDFGTGYSSLSYLKRLPIQTLKLDRSFVSDLPGDAEDAAIACATLSMAADLGVEVVAEGVETEAQRDYLRARGCRLMQGYFFSRPLTAANIFTTG
jgi:diguanylate cyclase (GGDEF)-like protein